MTHLETVSIRYCAKRPVVEQLVQCGLFPCTPLRPTLAIDIFMLEWATTLFLHMAPNVHAWTMATEIMLKHKGYAFNTSDSLHRCFNNPLVHYQILIQLVDAEAAQMVNAVPPPQSCVWRRLSTNTSCHSQGLTRTDCSCMPIQVTPFQPYTGLLSDREHVPHK